MATKASSLVAGVPPQIVLVVEDDAEALPVIASVLWEIDYDVVEVADPHRARELLDRGLRPGLLILNLSAKHLAGWDLWDHRQTTPSLQRVPVIVISDMGTNLVVGDAHVLAKPIDRELLVQKMTALFPSSKPRRTRV